MGIKTIQLKLKLKYFHCLIILFISGNIFGSDYNFQIIGNHLICSNQNCNFYLDTIFHQKESIEWHILKPNNNIFIVLTDTLNTNQFLNKIEGTYYLQVYLKNKLLNKDTFKLIVLSKPESPKNINGNDIIESNYPYKYKVENVKTSANLIWDCNGATVNLLDSNAVENILQFIYNKPTFRNRIISLF